MTISYLGCFQQHFSLQNHQLVDPSIGGGHFSLYLI